MCTTGREQSSTNNANINALCVLEGSQIPLRVNVLGSEENQEGQLKTWRLKLCTEDARNMRDEHSQIDQAHSYDIVVPGKCLIPSASFLDMNPDKSRQPKKLVFGNNYYSATIKNVNATDVVAWAPPFILDRTELIPCTLYYAGVDMLTSEAVAFVCPLKYISESTLAYKMHISCQKIKGWGRVLRVPITDIYRWEDISRRRMLLQTELTFETIKSSPSEVGRKKVYTFLYKQSTAEAEQKPAGKNIDLKSVVYPELEKEVSTLQKVQKSLDGEAFDNNKGKLGTRLSVGERDDYTQQKTDVTAERTEKKRTETKIDPLRRQAGSDIFREDDRYEIREGSVAKAKRQFSKEESRELNKTNYSSISRDMRRNASIEYDDYKVILFGKCFVEEEKFEKQISKEFECGDMVIATPKYQDDIIGQVGLICKIPSIHQEQIFVGVIFEERINVSPFEVRHIWEDEEQCRQHCRHGNHVFIPMDFLLQRHDYSLSERRLRVLKDTAKDDKRKNKEIISTSDIHVNFQYEAARRDFVQAPLDFNKLSSVKLKHMGIQGNANSCYIDAVLFALYSFTNNFDEGLLKQESYNKRKDDLKVKIEAARNLLKYDIVTPLRCALKVDWVHVYKLRRALADILNDKSYLGKFMDAEHFIASLFATVLQAPEFFEIGEDTKEYVLQLFPPMVQEGQDQIERPSVQYLLEGYCNWAGIKLRTMPQTGFLIKLPVCDGVRQYKVVYPNLNLYLDTLLDKKDHAKNYMVLRSIICLKKSHFTCFVRINTENKLTKPTWLFHDSMAAELGQSILTECEGLEEALQLVAPIFSNPSKKTNTSGLDEDVKKWLDRLLSTAYICVYEPPYRSTQM